MIDNAVPEEEADETQDQRLAAGSTRFAHDSIARSRRACGRQRCESRRSRRVSVDSRDRSRRHGCRLLVEQEGHLWVSDFGLARFQGSGDLTGSGDLPGTLRYTSPEQATGHRILDARTDVYSLGAILYGMLTGRAAFDGRERHDLIRQITHDEPIAPRKLNRAIPRDLEMIVAKAMATEPERRYATANELAIVPRSVRL
jgi:hypothetical protein